jgi:hypothetical protein
MLPLLVSFLCEYLNNFVRIKDHSLRTFIAFILERHLLENGSINCFDEKIKARMDTWKALLTFLTPWLSTLFRSPVMVERAVAQ